MARADAVECSLTALRFFRDSDQSGSPEATGYKGFYFHFLDMHTGARVWRSELSMIDTALLIAGALTGRHVLHREHARRNRAAQARRRAVPPHRLALGAERRLRRSPTAGNPNADSCTTAGRATARPSCCTCLRWARRRTRSRTTAYRAWTATYQWENLYGYDFLYAGPLFVHQFSHAWIDFRGIQDRFMREKRCDYFENSRRATQVQREYARRNPHGFAGYDENCWGLTRLRWPERSNCRGWPTSGAACSAMPRVACLTDPTTEPSTASAALASLPFAPEIALCAVRNMIRRYPEMLSAQRYASSFNPTLASADRARLGFGRPLRARPGHRGDDDRKPSHPTDLAADAGLSPYRHWFAPRGIPRRLAVAAAFIYGSRRCCCTGNQT